MTPNQAAFLSLIRFSEGTDPNPWGKDPYLVCFKNAHTIQDLAQHPATGTPPEWGGVDLEPIYGPKYKDLRTTAAGAYQITKTTYLDLSAVLGTTDFQPFTQDAMALELVRRCRALPSVAAGYIETAINLCSRTWASLPGSSSGQHVQPLQVLLSHFNSQPGVMLA